jgi:hypothetical protein
MTQQMRFSKKMILAYGTYIILILSTAFGQPKVDTSAIGNWMGSIEMGGANFRLVFHINISEVRTLIGTVDSPDKGVKGIPLSRVYVDGDSLEFAISAASASYVGRFSNEKTKIKGIWKEGETVFPLILNRTIDTIESKTIHDYAKENAINLVLQKTSEHFDIYSCNPDQKVLDDVVKVLEENYDRITIRLQTKFTEKIRVFVYPNTKTFHSAMYMTYAPDWFVGAAGINELKMVSPLNPGSAHTYASLMQAIVHELVHAAVLNVRGERGLVGLPKWLNEGYAFYEAHQMTDEMRRIVKIHAMDKTIPTFVQLDIASSVEFGNMNGYAFSTTIIEFLVNTYGFQKLLKLIREPENIDTIYGLSKEDLEKQWVQYIKSMLLK